MNTKTYQSTSSYGKLHIEETWLIPLIKELLPKANGKLVGLLGAPDGIDRHISNECELGISRHNQYYVEKDKKQYQQVHPHIRNMCSYINNDIYRVATNLLNKRELISILDFDACSTYSDEYINIISLAKQNISRIDVTILAMSLRTGGDKLNTEMWDSYGIDPKLPYKDKIICHIEQECKEVNLRSFFHTYCGSGSTIDDKRGAPMLLAVLAK